MAEDENKEREKLQDHLEEVCGFSREQLLKEMEQAENSVKDSDFPGAEGRIFRRLMQLEAEEQKKPAKKVVRFGKKKVLLTVALAAVFGLMLGMTAIGGKSYFFKRSNKDNAASSILLDNDKNKIEAGKMDEAYGKIKKELMFKL